MTLLQSPSLERPGETPAARTRVRILLVDDEPMFVEVLVAMLDLDSRAEVVGRAGNGVEGVVMARALRPDVVLMDLDMPFMNGIEATARIRRELPDTRVVVVTGSDRPSDADDARLAGAAGFVTKGCVEAELAEAVLGASA